MALGTPPVYVSNTRQLQGFLSLRKTTEELSLYAEITERKEGEVCPNDGGREKRLYAYSSERERSDVESSCDDHNGFRFEYNDNSPCTEVEGENDKVAGENDKVAREDEVDEDDVEFESEVERENDKVAGEDEVVEADVEFESRFDMFDDSDGASSEDDNFNSYSESPAVDEESPTLPPKKISHNLSKSENPEVLRSIYLLEVVVGQRYEIKSDLVRRSRLLTLRDRFDFDVVASNKDTLIVECWVVGCLSRVCASAQGDSPAFYVRIYCSEHTCSVTERANRCRQATPEILGQLLYRDLIDDIGPSVIPKSVGITINKQFGIKMDYWKSHRTLKYAREIDEGTPEIGFENMPSYLYLIRKANPGTIARLQIDGYGRFMYVFLAFGASIDGFPRMRKVVIVDGTVGVESRTTGRVYLTFL